MNSSRRSMLMAVALLLAEGPLRPSEAAWPTSPYNSGNIVIASALNAPNGAISDGTGGVFVLCPDARSGGFDLYLQHFLGDGTVAPGWPASGRPVCTAAGENNGLSMVADGYGGVIVGWADHRVPAKQFDIYVQRITSAGLIYPGWPVDGLAVSTSPKAESFPLLAPDGLGGAFLVWDLTFAAGDVDVYGAHVTPGGLVVFNDGLFETGFMEKEARIAADGAGGFLVAWLDSSAGSYDVRVARYNGAVSPVWGPVFVCGLFGDQVNLEIAGDGAGGVFMVWSDPRTDYQGDIYGSYFVDGSPFGAWQGTGSGIPICNSPGAQVDPNIALDGTGGVLIDWRDTRAYVFPENPADFYLDRRGASGSRAPGWPDQGFPVSQAGGSQGPHYVLPSIVPDGTGGGLVVWSDDRGAPSAFDDEIYALRVTANAAIAPHWIVNGSPICIAAGEQQQVIPVADGAGGAILVWGDYRGGTLVTYAQRVDRFGALGDVAPHLTSVRDVGGDQGGSVRLAWNRSPLDADPGYEIGAYWIWRQTPLAAAEQQVAAGAGSWSEDDATENAIVSGEGAVDADASGANAGPAAPLFRRAENASAAYAWEFVASLPTNASLQYSYVATTTRDSLPGSNPYTVFMVEARQSFGFAYWDSPPDSGYSADNLAPATPAPFTGQYAAGVTELSWGQNFEPDLAGYRVYRSDDPAFVPGPGNLVTSTTQTQFDDAGGGPKVYKLVAVDHHGNTSQPAVLLPSGTLDAEDAALPRELALAPVAPTPVRDFARIGFDLPSPSRVRVSVFDAAGRRVAALLDESRAPGRHAIDWRGTDSAGRRLNAGMYLVTLEAMGRRLQRRIVLID